MTNLVTAAAAISKKYALLSHEEAVDIARIVLTTLREPSEEMLQSTDNISLEAQRDNPNRGLIFWQSMIDAALSVDA